MLHVPPPERALVIGCGEGEPALFLAREFPGARIRAVDPSAPRIRAAQARVGLDPEARLAFKRARPGSLPYPDGFFDLAVLVEGRAVPAELARVLRAGGHLALAGRRPTAPARIGERLLRRRLRRRGFAIGRAADAGEGRYLLAVLAAGRRGPRSI